MVFMNIFLYIYIYIYIYFKIYFCDYLLNLLVLRMIFHEKSCDRLCLLDFNEWNCIIIFLYGTIKLIIILS